MQKIFIRIQKKRNQMMLSKHLHQSLEGGDLQSLHLRVAQQKMTQASHQGEGAREHQPIKIAQREMRWATQKYQNTIKQPKRQHKGRWICKGKKKSAAQEKEMSIYQQACSSLQDLFHFSIQKMNLLKHQKHFTFIKNI